ncbi:unnamed protein product [Rangifer tarandus platyrhynchus]|uniref:Uncharacterized protein n=1 Tax=Rangifer tarandus platyrhynchus TaxID=3082113 RepID=A0ABN8Y069_RANTA|nr:unnamed protein product [Rangifer tarandus platyrhynchus]
MPPPRSHTDTFAAQQLLNQYAPAQANHTGPGVCADENTQPRPCVQGSTCPLPLGVVRSPRAVRAISGSRARSLPQNQAHSHPHPESGAPTGRVWKASPPTRVCRMAEGLGASGGRRQEGSGG